MPSYLVGTYFAEEILTVLAFVATYFLASLVGRSFDSRVTYRLYALGRAAATLIVGALGATSLRGVTQLVATVIVGLPSFQQPPTPVDVRAQMLVVLVAAVLVGAAVVFRIESWYRTEVGVAGKRKAGEGETEWKGADEPHPTR
jgi:fructose-specific phosphotransferase system IIC component